MEIIITRGLEERSLPDSDDFDRKNVFLDDDGELKSYEEAGWKKAFVLRDGTRYEYEEPKRAEEAPRSEKKG